MEYNNNNLHDLYSFNAVGTEKSLRLSTFSLYKLRYIPVSLLWK